MGPWMVPQRLCWLEARKLWRKRDKALLAGVSHGSACSLAEGGELTLAQASSGRSKVTHAGADGTGLHTPHSRCVLQSEVTD